MNLDLPLQHRGGQAMSGTKRNWLAAAAVAALALTAGCEPGLQTYITETAANRACGDDEVVYGLFMKGAMWNYQTKASPWYGGGTDTVHTGQYACLSEMIRMKIPCGPYHNPDDGPLPYAL